MKSVVTIKGQPVIEVYESLDGSYWFVTEKAWKQDSLIGRKVYKQDQILYGYVRLSSCPECAEFGYFSEAELMRLGWRVWKVERKNWAVGPAVEVQEVPDEPGGVEAAGCGRCCAYTETTRCVFGASFGLLTYSKPHGRDSMTCHVPYSSSMAIRARRVHPHWDERKT